MRRRNYSLHLTYAVRENFKAVVLSTALKFMLSYNIFKKQTNKHLNYYKLYLFTLFIKKEICNLINL